MHRPSERAKFAGREPLGGLLLIFTLVFSSQVSGETTEVSVALQRLTEERQMLTSELDQYRKTLEVLLTDGTPPEQSPNPAIRTLAIAVVEVKQKLITVTEQEVTLLQQEIVATKSKSAATAPVDPVSMPAVQPPSGNNAIESKPRRTNAIEDTLEQEANNVERLHQLLQGYYAELQESAKILPTADEMARRETAKRDAETLDKIPFSVDKVRLSGYEGSTALATISKRLMDPTMPESRRDIAPICSIRTRLLETLVGSENRSLKPIGKNHYVARVRLQPGDTTLSVLSHQWEVSLPHQTEARDYLITLYRPVDGVPELHVFAIDDLLAADKPHIPAWLPAELDIKKKAG